MKTKCWIQLSIQEDTTGGIVFRATDGLMAENYSAAAHSVMARVTGWPCRKLENVQQQQ